VPVALGTGLSVPLTGVMLEKQGKRKYLDKLSLLSYYAPAL